MSQPLFSAFSPATAQQWRAAIEKSLKGKPYEELFTRTEEGLVLAPFYTAEDIEGLVPGMPPTPHTGTWQVRRNIETTDVRAANKQALEILQQGVTALGFRCTGQPELETLLDNIHFQYVPLYFELESDSHEVLEGLLQLVDERGLAHEDIRGNLGSDPLETGGDPDRLATTVQQAHEELPHMGTIECSAAPFHYGGCNRVQELALTIAKGADYLQQLGDKGLDREVVAEQLLFHIPLQRDYFMAIAKLRALRRLWAAVGEGFGISMPANIYALNSHRGEHQDGYYNLIAMTTQCAAAAVGGADIIAMNSNDETEQTANSSFQRIATNIQLVLHHEGHLDKVTDPATGSYYIEKLTHELTERAWQLFLQIEAKGGYRAVRQSNELETLLNTKTEEAGA